MPKCSSGKGYSVVKKKDTTFIPIVMDFKTPHLDTKLRTSSYLASHRSANHNVWVEGWISPKTSDLTSGLITHTPTLITSWEHFGSGKSWLRRDVGWNLLSQNTQERETTSKSTGLVCLSFTSKNSGQKITLEQLAIWVPQQAREPLWSVPTYRGKIIPVPPALIEK